jgi:hypothetical protein
VCVCVCVCVCVSCHFEWSQCCNIQGYVVQNMKALWSSECQQLITQWCSVASQKTWTFQLQTTVQAHCFENRPQNFTHSLHWHVQNVTIPCHTLELLQFPSVMYFFLPPFSTNYSSILSHLILSSISWSTSQSYSQIHIQYSFGNSIFFHSL